MKKTSITVEFGPMAPSLSKQLKNIISAEDCAIAQGSREAIELLMRRQLLSETEIRKAELRLIKWIQKRQIKTTEKARA